MTLRREGKLLSFFSLALIGACLTGCSMQTTGFKAESVPRGIWSVDVGPASARFDAVALVTETVKAGKGIVSVFIPVVP